MRECNYQTILEDISKEIEVLYGEGKVADYIPALAQVESKQFAMSITTVEGRNYHTGVHKQKFSIQSISKVFTLTMALQIYGKNIYKRVGREPSGNAFNSLVQLEYEDGIPRNPFINAGAIVISDLLFSHFKEQTDEKILNFFRELSGEKEIVHNSEVLNSELEHGFRNEALASFMKSFSNIKSSIDEVLKSYFTHCSIEMNTDELSQSMLFLANHGVDPITKKEFLTQSQAKRINAIMLTCGHYDASGDFAFRVGLPGKSGVGGGIVAIVPNKMAIAVFSPALNEHGNSLIGTKALELFTTKTGLSIF